jgi:membrane protease YdiL (CAAX protease family)
MSESINIENNMQNHHSPPRSVKRIVPDTITCPAAWCFTAVWSIAAIYLIAIGKFSIVLRALVLLVIVIFFCLLTVRITEKEHKPKEKSSQKGKVLLFLQIAVIAFFICITFYTSLMFHDVVKQRSIPLWSPLINAFGDLGKKLLNPDYIGGPPSLAMANTAKYFILPLPLLLLLRARITRLGLCRGHRTFFVVALWCFIPIGFLMYMLASGSLTLKTIVRRFFMHLFQNGFGEEFLFRGALQTRLKTFLTPSWSIVIQALLFGLWHFSANFGYKGTNSTPAVIAFCILLQATAGLAFGIIFHRTRNLVACTLVHIITNCVSIN